MIKSGFDNFLNILNNLNTYGNNNYMDKNLFGKIMKEFDINISNEIINIIYKNKTSINFIHFIYDLINKYISKDIINIIENIYEKLNMYYLNTSGKNINLNFIEHFSNCFNKFEKFHSILYEKNFEQNNKKDIYDLINNKKNAKIEKDEFILFYKFIYFFSGEDLTNIKNMINQHWNNILDKNKDVISNKKYVNNINKISNKEPEVILKLKSKLKQRGIRGLMNLHKEFIITCSNISGMFLQDLINVFNNQRISLTKEEIKEIFNLFRFSENHKNFNVTKFISVFKKRLNKERLNIVQKCFEKLDINKDDSVNINLIKDKFNSKIDRYLINKEKNEEEILCEFLDCFDLNINLIYNKDLFWDNKIINISFDEFANFYEYVSFLYDNNNEFIQLVNNSWNFN